MSKSLYEVSWAEKAFSGAECDRILGKFTPGEFRPGLVIKESGKSEVSDESARKSSIRFVPFNNEDKWIFDRFHQVATMANQALRFELKGFDEGFQVGRYAQGEFYDWHADLGADGSAMRKLSLVVQLTSPTEYDGGDLEFFPSPIIAPRDRGTIVVFPSYIPHRVLPVTRGVRYSLASWIAGATPFR